MKFIGVPHRKQFVIGPSEQLLNINLPDRFREVQLNSGLSIRFCPDLKTASTTDVEGNVVFLIGTVVEADPEKKTPEQILRLINHSNLEEMTVSWCGHWLLVIGEFIYGDCCGLFSLYQPRPRLLDKSGILFCSNSPVLMSRIYGLEIGGFHPKKAAPLPMAPTTFVSDLRVMLAGQRLNLLSAERSFPFVLFKPIDMELDEIRTKVAGFLATTVKRLHELTNESLLCALSGGYDTRLNLAASKASGVPVQAYTFEKPYFYITEADRLLPPLIGRSTGVQHKMIRATPPSLPRSRAYIEHSGGMVSKFPGSGYDHYVHGYWDQSGVGKPVLDGQCYELAVNYHRQKFPEDFNLSHLKKFGFHLTEEDYLELQDYWQNQPLSPKFDRRDLIFLSGNINGVYARMTQEHDLFADLFYPACNREQFNLLLSVPMNSREACHFQGSITALLCPELDKFPYNPAEPLFKRVVKRSRNEILRLLKL